MREPVSERVSGWVCMQSGRGGAGHKGRERERERENENKWQAGSGVVHIELKHVFRC